jgi:glycerophosphoryl diester phosphodiesterase
MSYMVSTKNREVAVTLERAPAPGAGRVPICYAHRGARAYAPENTLLAFAIAFDLGADAVECDVQRSRDGGLVIFHDGLVDRTTDGTGPVADMTLAELRSLDAGHYRRTPQHIPTLDETLALVRDRGAAVNLEIKGESAGESVGTAQACVPVLRALEDAFRPSILVSSFDHTALAAIKRELPWLRIGALFGKAWRGADLIAPARKLGAEAIHPDARLVTPDLIRRAHGASLRLNVWTVNKPAAIRSLIAWGVDGIFSDYPDRVILARAVATTDIGRPSVPATA